MLTTDDVLDAILDLFEQRRNPYYGLGVACSPGYSYWFDAHHMAGCSFSCLSHVERMSKEDLDRHPFVPLGVRLDSFLRIMVGREIEVSADLDRDDVGSFEGMSALLIRALVGSKLYRSRLMHLRYCYFDVGAYRFTAFERRRRSSNGLEAFEHDGGCSPVYVGGESTSLSIVPATPTGRVYVARWTGGDDYVKSAEFTYEGCKVETVMCDT